MQKTPALVLAILILAAATRGASAQVLPIEALHELARGRGELIRTLRISYEVYQDPDRRQTTAQIPHILRHVLVDARNGRYSIDRTIVVSGLATEPSGKVTTHFDFDGVAQGAYLPERGIGLLKEGADLHPLAESGLWGIMMWSPPHPEGLGIDDGSLVSLLKRGRVRGELELVGDRPCHVVDAFEEGVRYATVWLDVERDLLPMRRVTYGHDGQPVVEVTVETVVYLEDQDLWLPESWRTTLRLQGRTLTKRTVVHPESVEINPPLDEHDFAPRFPPGTIVTDQIAGLTYRVGPEGEPAEVLYEQTDDGQWHQVAPADAGNPDRAVAGRPKTATEEALPAGRPPLAGIDELLALARRAVRGGQPASRGPTPRPANGTAPRHTANRPRQAAVHEPTGRVRHAETALRASGKPAIETPEPGARLAAMLRSPYLWAGLAVLVLAVAIGRVRGVHS